MNKLSRLGRSAWRLQDCITRAEEATDEEKKNLVDGLMKICEQIAEIYKREKPCRRCDGDTLCGDDCLNGGNV